jgi:hypothetical protein
MNEKKMIQNQRWSATKRDSAHGKHAGGQKGKKVAAKRHMINRPRLLRTK